MNGLMQMILAEWTESINEAYHIRLRAAAEGRRYIQEGGETPVLDALVNLFVRVRAVCECECECECTQKLSDAVQSVRDAIGRIPR